MNGNFKDSRLIEAFDYIDPKYVAEVGESLKLRSVYAKEYVKPTFGKQVKQIALLVGCLLLLSCAFPAFNYVLEVVSSMAAGWGSEATEENTDKNDILYTYPIFVDDLEYLSVEEMIKINDAYKEYLYDRVYRLSYNAYIYDGSISEEEADKKAREDAENESSRYDHRFFNERWIKRYKYYGVFGECVVLVQEGNLTQYAEIVIDEFTFAYANNATMFAYRNGKIYELSNAYEMGLLTSEDIARVYDRYKAYDIFERK